MQAKEIWEKLSQVDVSDHVEQKMGLSYLSWAWAYGTLMEHFPDAKFAFREFTRPDGTITDAMEYPNKTASVHCTVEIGEVSRSIWLPVMDNRNRAIPDPDARAISDAKMRALVKCIALHGLGHYIFAGEDLPPEKKGDPIPEESNEAAESTEKSTENKNDPGADGATLAIYSTFCEECKSMKELKEFWTKNAGELKKLEKQNPETYKKILELFSNKKSKLMEQE